MKDLEKQIKRLKEENCCLKSENEELKYILNDIQAIRMPKNTDLKKLVVVLFWTTPGAVLILSGFC